MKLSVRLMFKLPELNLDYNLLKRISTQISFVEALYKEKPDYRHLKNVSYLKFLNIFKIFSAVKN